MLEEFREFLVKLTNSATRDISLAWRALRERGPSNVQFWFIALAIGIVAGCGALVFRIAISALQELLYGADAKDLTSTIRSLPVYLVIGIPIAGGLVVGIILSVFTRDKRAHSVADVIHGAALGNGRVNVREGIASAIASLITLSTGGSTGREGPVVHMAASLSSWVSDRLSADGITARDLMGCAVAAAVSASFNAPIAGALFALEVVLRHFAVHAFAPIVIASVAGTVVSRLQMGNVTEFVLPTHELSFYIELPAFLAMGAICGLVAFVLMRGIFLAEDIGDRVQRATRMPNWLRPAVAGGLLGVIALWFPHIIGVGYETTSDALTSGLLFREAVIFAVLKVIAVAITFAGRMGGGVFSPSLMIGALTGLAFGIVATSIFPSVSGSEGLYALAGMGAVAAAVLGAPISTTLIVFELTGDWVAGIAVMVSVSLASALSARLVHRSFFLTQLERRGLPMAKGPQDYVLTTINVGRIMCPMGGDRSPGVGQCADLLEQGAGLDVAETLQSALPKIEASGLDFLPVTRANENATPELLGVVFLTDALRAYNRALAEVAKEEHS